MAESKGCLRGLLLELVVWPLVFLGYVGLGVLLTARVTDDDGVAVLLILGWAVLGLALLVLGIRASRRRRA